MRSFAELAYRLRQELANFGMLAVPPRLPEEALRLSPPLAGLPNPEAVAEALRGTAYAAGLESLARNILAHRFPLLGFEIQTGPSIDWSRDYAHGRTAPGGYFRFLPYLDFERAGDHKVIWELNRHQHLVLLAQAWRLTGKREYLDEVGRQIEKWIAANPFLKGINWTSALEVAFRALSWIWIFHLAGDGLKDTARRRILTALYRHGCYLAHNLSVYFSPNTHLLGEAVALHALGTLFPRFPGASGWSRAGGAVVSDALTRQVRDDGSHFEQSSYYHLYALDLFLLHVALGGRLPQDRLIRMAEFLEAVMGPTRTLPFLGDDDGGRLFHPFGPRNGFGRATLATCGVLFERPGWVSSESDLWEQADWWVGPRRETARPDAAETRTSQWFADAGLAAWRCGEAHVLVDAGGFGSGSGGHSHSDTLSLVVRFGEEEILIDPGAYTYVSDPVWRDWFRGSPAHSTVRVDERDQAEAAGPFRWNGHPEVAVLERRSSAGEELLEAVCRYRGIAHRRRILWTKPGRIEILDEVTGGAGQRVVEQFWHAGSEVTPLAPYCFRIGNRARLWLDESAHAEQVEGWRSPALGVKTGTIRIRVVQRSALPVSFRAVLDLTE